MIPPFGAEDERIDTADFWKGICETLAKGAEAAAPLGLQVLWHTHAYACQKLPDGTRLIPAAERARDADRIQVIQTKDVAPAGTEIDDGWDATGDGIIDCNARAPLLRGSNVHHLCTEHDTPTGKSSQNGHALGPPPRKGPRFAVGLFRV